DLGEASSEGRGMNDTGAAAGWGYDPNNPNCPTRRALYWNSVGSLTNLGNTMPSGQSGQQSRAEAVNNHSSTQVVGWNDDADKALLWEKPSSTWTVTNLNDSGHPNYVIPGCSDSNWDIMQAHDINDCGWIIAWGDDASQTGLQTHALLLVPFGECRWDVNQDGAVNTTDYLAVISHDGACPTSAICWWDVNDDCQVSTLDRQAVASHFGTCGDTGCDGGGSQSLMAGGGEPPVAAPMDEELMGFWLDSGGHDAIVNGEITDEQIIAALQGESDEAKLIALFALLAQ
ncbi:MAG: dockerin type I domain-containing protein, partial [Phycisphaerales bacterium]|nr:dockerin type I domain-containing protein [Phycisphaerales bacterium]